MTAFTKINNLAWTNPAAWDVGSGYPSSGADTATLGAYSTEIESSDAITCGAITTTGTGGGTRSTITINGSLKLAAAWTLNAYTQIDLNPGGILDFDGNNLDVAVYASGRYWFNLIGTAGNRAKVKSTAGGGTFLKSGGEAYADVDWQYCDFTDIGDIKLGYLAFSGEDVSVQDCTFTSCWKVELGGHRHADNSLIFRRNDVRPTLTTDCVYLRNENNAIGPGVIDTSSNTFGAATTATIRTNGHGFDFASSVFDEVNIVKIVDHPVGQNDCLIRMSANVGDLGSGANDTITDTYVCMEGQNVHTTNGVFSIFTGNVIETTNAAGDDGDHFIVTNNNATVEYNLILEKQSGVLMNSLGSAKSGTYNCNHNTLVGDYDAAYGALARNESGGTFTGTLNLQSNIIYDRSAAAGSLGFNFDGVTNDQVSLMDYNNWYAIEDPYSGVISTTKTAGVTVGFGGLDTTVDPQFVDDTRGLAAWDTEQGTGTGTTDAAVAELLTINGYNSTSKDQVVSEKSTHLPSDIVTWVRAGYAPQNAILEDAGHDSITVGAIEYIAASALGDQGIFYKTLLQGQM